MDRRDYLLRFVEELTLAVSAIAKLRQDGALHEARRLLDQSISRLLGMPRPMLESLDVPSLALLLRAPERIDAAVKLLQEEAALLRAEGRALAGDNRETRAHALASSVARAGKPSP